MARERILVVEDEEDILRLITYNLVKEGFIPTGVLSGEEAMAKARLMPPDAIVLDLMLPNMTGLEVCKQLRSEPKTQHVPIIMLTAKGEESDVVAGLEVGADDYLVKPFSPRVLLARIRAVLRRKSREASGESRVVNLGGITIHPGRHEVMIDGCHVSLTHLEFKVLHFLARRPGWVYSRGQIVDGVRGDNYPVTDRSVDVLIVGLRRKLGPHGRRIETVRGVGYRFKEEEEE